MLTNTPTHYGLIARALHWGMVLLVLTAAVMGFWMADLPDHDPGRLAILGIHQGLGLLVFLLFVVRFIWRWYDPPPLYEFTLPRWERITAFGVHLTLYALLALIPIVGYLISASKGKPLDVFGIITIPPLFDMEAPWSEGLGQLHLFLVLLLACMVLMHVGATVKHHFFDRQLTLHRMIEFFH